ncbi:MAG: LuxR family transcriptional regulator [Alphaproteobacteria bacterium]|nr:MAG: LuxR family transcriptional regulator [Alphaproteobacteria bacterium]
MYIDSHCHLTHSHITELGNAAEIVANANKANVVGMQTICCRIAEEFDDILTTVKPMKNVWCSVGTHPHDASVEAEKAYSVDDIVKLANSDPKVIGIGESGLDYFYDHADRKDQEIGFRKHIQAAQETGLPLIVHSRDADDDCIRILKEEGAGVKNIRGVLHCFSSSEKMAMEGLDLGFYISFSGMITFKKMDWLRDIAAKVPMDRLLIETDAPFLAPAPFRGKTNQPAYIENTALAVAKIFDKTRTEMGQITADNFFTLFDKALQTWEKP